ncbi:MAG: hypothetical protein CFE45_09525 [Burkholderiales bacterium PBB5]|nr:MAG: hypothetical protein CFE45_09525 [Burkholderiales bacterium PBB5]
MVGLAALSFNVSAAGLLFQGVLAPQLPAALGAALLRGCAAVTGGRLAVLVLVLAQDGRHTGAAPAG